LLAVENQGAAASYNTTTSRDTPTPSNVSS